MRIQIIGWFLNTKRYFFGSNGWSEALNKWNQNLSKRPPNIATLVRHSIPDELRGVVWQLLAGSQNETSFVEEYKVLITRDSLFEKYIERDINRTFAANEFLEVSGFLGQDSLFNVCKAYSNYDTEIGHRQGLSFLVEALLHHMPEEQAFCVLNKIMNEYGLRTLFRNGYEELDCKFYQLERAMDSLMPQLFSHLRYLGVRAHMFASQWFLTLFTDTLPLNVVFPILDLFFLDRMDTIFQVALALLSISKKDLLALDFEGVLKYFRVSLPKRFRTEENGKFLLKTAVSIRVKKLKKYRKEYQLYKESAKALKQINDEIQCLKEKVKRELEEALHEIQMNAKIILEYEAIPCPSSTSGESFTINTPPRDGSGSESIPTASKCLPKFCHQCGTNYPTTVAKYCYECGSAVWEQLDPLLRTSLE